MDNKRGPAVSSGKAAQCQAAAWMGGEFGGKWIHVYAWLSPFTVNWNYHNIANFLYLNKKLKMLKNI